MKKETLGWCVAYNYFSLEDKAWHEEIWAKVKWQLDAVVVLKRLAHDFDFKVSKDGTVATKDYMMAGIHSFRVVQTGFAS